MRRWFCLWAFALLLPTLAIAATPITVDATELIPVWPALRVVGIADPDVTADIAAASIDGANAQSIMSPAQILGRGSIPHWAAFSLRHDEAIDQWRLLAFEATTQHEVQLFQRREGRWQQVASIADAAKLRLGGGTPYPAWAIRLPPHETSEFLLRVAGPALLRYPVFLYRPTTFFEIQRKFHILVGIALAACLLSAAFIGSLRHYLRDRSVFLSICMILSNLFAALWLSGYLAELFPALGEEMLSIIGFLAFSSLLGCGSLHARIYLNTAQWAPLADRWLQFSGWCFLAMAAWFAAAFPIGARAVTIWGGMAVSLLLVSVSLMAAWRKMPFSGFIAAAWSMYFVFAAVHAGARTLTGLSIWPPSELGLLETTLAAIFFAFAMSQRLMQQRDRLLAANQEAAMQRQKMTAIMRERSLLFAATNHDLRQPLLGVGMFAHLAAQAADPAEKTRHLQKLDSALKEVDDLLVNMQELAKVHESVQQPPLEKVRLDALLAPVIEEYRARAAYKHITIRYVPTGLTLTTRVPYFLRIVRNILSNAIRYADFGNRVVVGCRRGGGLRLLIADNGRGMTEEQINLAFGAFRRFDVEPPVPDGFGLGLFSTQTLANALGLSINLRSQIGRGTSFMIFL